MAGAAKSGLLQDGNVWTENIRALLLVLITLGTAFSISYFRRLNELFPGHHPAFIALLSGVIVTVVTYFPMTVADRKYALSNSVLLGLLVAEFVVYGAPFTSTATAIAFLGFMFLYGRESADQLWPKSYNGSL